jgi:hypothetical protein
MAIVACLGFFVIRSPLDAGLDRPLLQEARKLAMSKALFRLSMK